VRYRLALDAAFNGTLAMQLPVVCRRRYGVIPPISRVTGQVGNWGTVGQNRTLVFRGGGSLRETLLHVDRPRSWSYTPSDTGPLAALLSRIEGEFLFAPAGTGTRITWRYIVHARSGPAAPALPIFAWSWRGYARQTLEELSGLLVA